MISAPWRRPNLGALTSSSPTHNTSTSSPHTRPDAAATCEEFAAKAPESSNRQNRQQVRVTGERLSAEETNRGSSTKHRNNHNTWDSELVHLGCPWHSFSYPDPKRKKMNRQKTNPGINARQWPRQAVYFTLIWFWYSRTPFVSASPRPSRPSPCMLKP